jgi:hypothetical protein
MAEKNKKILEIEIDVESGKVKVLGNELDNVGKKAKKAKEGVGGIAGAFKKVGTAMKAAGIGLVIALLATLKEVFGENQTVVDTFSTAMTGLKIAFNDFFQFVSGNLSTVTGFFKALFDDPVKSIKDLGSALYDGIIVRFEQFIETLGIAGKAFAQFMAGDFTTAWETAKEAAKDSFDIITGKDGGYETVIEMAKEAASAIVDYTTETWKSADALTQQAKAMEFSEIASRKLQLQYQKEAEDLRQIRDDETKTISERIRANEQLGIVLQKAIEAEKAEVQTRIDFAIKQNKLIGQTQERLKEIESLRVEQLDIEERLGGVMSEQLVNQNSLLREQVDAIKQLDAVSADSTVAQIIALEQLYDERVILAEKFIDDEVERKRYLEEIELDHQAKIKAIEDAAAAEKKKKDADELKAAQELNEAKMSLAVDAFGALIALNNAFAGATEEQQRKAFQRDKALKIGQAIMSTAQAVTSALAQTIDPTPLQILRFGNAAIAGAMGIAQVATIAKTQFNPSGGSSSGGGMPSISAPTSGGGAPQFNTVGTSGFNQLSDSIAGQNNRPVQAYVVASDVSSAQSLERNRVQQASFP